MALEAISLIPEAKRPPTVFVLGQDEEVGSDASRGLIEKIASECQAVFVLEPAQGIEPAAYKTARKGVGNYRIDVKGVAAHAGVDFQRGHSAILELARLLQTVAQFTDADKGLTVNPGVIGGGTRSNVIPAEAWAEIDVRIVRMADAERVDAMFRGLRCKEPACSVAVTGGINRPPMERSEGTAQLFKRAQGFAREMGFELEEASTGGGSDGNFTAALGVPTLDGMGAVGEGAHAANESVLVEHLVPRTHLLAKMIAAMA
jgi:glutamate carboxypeptidase